MTIVNFLVALKSAVSSFTEETSDTENITLENRRLRILDQNLVVSYYKLIDYYFRDTDISSDENFFTESEIREVIDKLNNIMKTYLYTDFT